MQKKVFLRTFGCQMNEYDSAKMLDLLAQKSQYQQTETIEEADLIILNTCSVREKAQEKVFSDLGRIKSLRKKRPTLLIGVTGCVASQEGEAIVKRAPYVNLVFGPQTYHRLPQMIETCLKTGTPQVDVSFPAIEKFDHLPPAKVNVPVGTVTIMEGCNRFCSYCIVPYTRGREFSRPAEDILKEIENLASQGVKEIILLGQNVNAYKGTYQSKVIDFAALIELVGEISDIKRIRFVTSHPSQFTRRLIDVYQKVPKLVSHLYLPAQHGSDRILAAMRRGYTALEYKSIIRRIKNIRPDLLVSSDFIVGFPGETDDDFEQLIDFVHEVDFDNSYSFLYSPRPGTPAASLKMDIPIEVRRQRLQRLQGTIDSLTRKHLQKQIGTIQTVLVDGPSQKHPLLTQGRTDSNRVVHFSVSNDVNVQKGDFADIQITGVDNYSLDGITIKKFS